jgi:hypothetical protein
MALYLSLEGMASIMASPTSLSTLIVILAGKFRAHAQDVVAWKATQAALMVVRYVSHYFTNVEQPVRSRVMPSSRAAQHATSRRLRWDTLATRLVPRQAPKLSLSLSHPQIRNPSHQLRALCEDLLSRTDLVDDMKADLTEMNSVCMRFVQQVIISNNNVSAVH